MNRACIEEKNRMQNTTQEVPHSDWDKVSDHLETLLQIRVREVRDVLRRNVRR